MENQEPWEPTFPVGYTLFPGTTYGGSGSSHPAHGPAYLSRWPAMDTLATPTSVATAAASASRAKAELEIRSSGGHSISGGAGRGGGNSGCGSRGVGGGGNGAKERLKTMANNNAYVDGPWSLFRHAGEMRLITCKTSLAGVELPASPIEQTCKA